MKASTLVLTVPALLIPALALAQGTPPDTGAPGAASATSPAATTAAPPPPAPPPAAAAPAPPPASPKEPEVADGATDHEKMVGHFAAGYLGVSQLPIAQVAGAGVSQGSVSAPVLGMRYWLNKRMGVDVGVGVGVSTATSSVTVGGVSTDTGTPATTGFALHAGVPFALAYSQHFTFELVPEVNFGYAGTYAHAAGGQPDIGLNGIRLDVGGRIGAELHFGFIGIPQLSLQGTIGVSFRYDTVWASQGNNGASLSTIGVGTTFQNDPWAIFTNSVAALYYF